MQAILRGIFYIICAIVGIVVLSGGALWFDFTSGKYSEDYRYKLSFAVKTPDGVKVGSYVTQLRESGAKFGGGFQMAGQALFLDLGPGRRPLVALLNQQNPPLVPRISERGNALAQWGDYGGLVVLWYTFTRSPFVMKPTPPDRLPGGHLLYTDIPLNMPRKIRPWQLPDLVTFSNINDQNSAIAVDPENLAATLGEGVEWQSITIERTEEPPTTDLKSKLPWLAHPAGDEISVRGGSAKRLWIDKPRWGTFVRDDF